MEPLNIVFMGTPEFAVPSLKKCAAHHRVSAVFCQPDRPKGRSKKPAPCPVKVAALELDIPVHQPKRIKAKKWVTILQELQPDLIVVAAFGQILSQTILDIPAIDCVNVHASLLPRWRGASPIHYAILDGDAEAGVAIMKMVRELDAGPYYSMASVPITPKLGRIELEAQLAELGGNLLLETIPNLAATTPTPQALDQVTYAPIIERSFGYVNFADKTAAEIERMTRAFEAWPQVQCLFRGQPVKLIEAQVEEGSGAPGTVVEVSKKVLKVACREGILSLKVVQPSGKKAQPIASFNNGYHPKEGECFEPMP